MGLSVDDDFGLLEALGRDVAGALRIGAHEPAEAAAWKPLGDKDLDKWSSGAPALPDEASEGIRLSLAGAQHKIGARREGDQYLHTAGGEATTHILKFGPRDLAHVPENEFFTLQLARALGLPVADAELELRWSRPVLVVDRFDRVTSDGSVQRVHQEDLCQALGRSRHDKYRVSFAEAYGAVTRVSRAPARDAQTLLTWQVFNVICGNDDGHAKNLSLTLDDGPRLAPIYDLVCTAAIDRLSRRLAFSIGGNDDSGNLVNKHWRSEEDTLRLRSGALTRVIETLLSKLPNALDVASEALAARVPNSQVLERVRVAITRRSKRVEQGLG